MTGKSNSEGEAKTSECPYENDRVLWLLGELPEVEMERVESHLETCSSCAADVSSLRGTLAMFQAHTSRASEASSACLDEAIIAEWVAGGGRETKQDVVSHLAQCSRCRRATAALAQALKAEPIASALGEIEGEQRDRITSVTSRQSGLHAKAKRVLAPVAIAAAAMIAGLVFLRSTELDVEDTAVHREPAADVMTAPVVQAPIGPVDVLQEFRWSAVRGADRYRLTVFDIQGSVVWELETVDSRAGLPTATTLEPGTQYLWKVAARLRLGRWVSSDLVAFTISEP